MNKENNNGWGSSVPQKKKLARLFSAITALGIFVFGYFIFVWMGIKIDLRELSLFQAIVILLVLVFVPFIHLFFQKIINLTEEHYEPKILNLKFKDFIAPWIALGAFCWSMTVVYFQDNKPISPTLEITNEQFEVQLKIQAKQLRDASFTKGIELLGNANESTRIGGVYQLHSLASEYRNEYEVMVSEILCAHIRTITGDDDYKKKYKDKPSNEIQTIVTLLFQKDQQDSMIFHKLRKDLKRAFLSKIDFREAIINKVDFREATIRNVNLLKATLSEVEFARATLDEGTIFNEAKLRKVDFNNAAITDVSFSRADLNEVSFSEAGLTKIHFDNAKFHKDVNFYKTPLAGKPHAQITCSGCALKLTTPKR